MDIFSKTREILVEILAQTIAEGCQLERITVEAPREAKHGDLSTNAAMVLAKQLQKKPRDLAQEICQLFQPKMRELGFVDEFAEFEIAGSGFINMHLSDDLWRRYIPIILKQKFSYGKTDIGKNQPINIEYVSANPTGPMHIGHARGAVFGDVLATLLDYVGYQVTREYYINDAGGQIDVLTKSVLLRVDEAFGKPIEVIPEGLYPGEYLKPVGEEIKEQYQEKWYQFSQTQQYDIIKTTAVDKMMVMIREDLMALGIQHDNFVSEKYIHHTGQVEQVLGVLEKMGVIYQGKLPPPKGKPIPLGWENKIQTLFKSTEFGDDQDRSLKKHDGSWTYFAPDIAYHFDKYNRGFDKMINVWGADHGGYIKRMQAAVAALTDNKAQLDVKLCQMVKLMRDGEVVKMSKRSGQFITLREVVDEVGKQALRFMMLTRKNDALLDFDFTQVKDKSRENPIFYVQYAHARICSVLKKAKVEGLYDEAQDIKHADLSLLMDDAEIDLLKQCALFPRIVEQAASHYEPHRITFFLIALATKFHMLWNLSKEKPELKFLYLENKNATIARCQMIRCVAIVIQSALKILGIEAEEEM